MFVHIRDNKTFGCLTVRHGTAAKEIMLNCTFSFRNFKNFNMGYVRAVIDTGSIDGSLAKP